MLRIKNTEDLKWYLYRSDAKLRMLYPQIAKMDASKTSFEWTLGIKGLASSTVKSESENTVDEDDMLKAVMERLESSGQVGSVEEPNIYIKGVMPMRWGMCNDMGERDADHGPLVYFGGFDEKAGLLLALGGSSKHVMGHEGATSTYSRSSTPALVDALTLGIESGKYEPRWEDQDERVFRAIAIAQHYLRPPTQNLEFFAKTLMVGETYGAEMYIGVEKAKVILATPLYVALVAPYPSDDHWGIIPEVSRATIL